MNTWIYIYIILQGNKTKICLLRVGCSSNEYLFVTNRLLALIWKFNALACQGKQRRRPQQGEFFVVQETSIWTHLLLSQHGKELATWRFCWTFMPEWPAVTDLWYELVPTVTLFSYGVLDKSQIQGHSCPVEAAFNLNNRVLGEVLRHNRKNPQIQAHYILRN